MNVPVCPVCDQPAPNLVEHLWGHHKGQLVDFLAGWAEYLARPTTR